MAPPCRRMQPDAGLRVGQAYYDAYAGTEARARRILTRVYGRPAHSASWEFCYIAEAEGDLIGVLAGFPSRRGEELARRFVGTLPRIPVWRWPRLLRHLQAAGHVAPRPPAGSWYVEALAVRYDWRRRGVARALLGEAEHQAKRNGSTGVALDTGLANGAPVPSTRPTASSAALCGAPPTNASPARSAAPASSATSRAVRADSFRASGPLLRGGSSETSSRRGGRRGAGVLRVRRRCDPRQPPGQGRHAGGHRPVAASTPTSEQGALHRPHPHDHADHAGVEGLRAGRRSSRRSTRARASRTRSPRTASRRRSTRSRPTSSARSSTRRRTGRRSTRRSTSCRRRSRSRPLVVISIVDQLKKKGDYHLQVADIQAWEKETAGSRRARS